LRQHLEAERFNFSETIDAALQLTEALTAAHDTPAVRLNATKIHRETRFRENANVFGDPFLRLNAYH
jgi:poly-beta-hydroxyalkanoate depolymerase